MSAEAIQAAAEVAKNSGRIKQVIDVAKAHPAAAVTVGAVVGVVAVWGGYKLLKRSFSDKPKGKTAEQHEYSETHTRTEK